MRISGKKITEPACGWRCYFYWFLLLIFHAVFDTDPPAVFSADSGIHYHVVIEGIAERKLQRLLEDVSNTVMRREKAVGSFTFLRQRIKQDIPGMVTALKSQGFYSARVIHEIDTRVSPVKVAFKVTLGPPYLLQYIHIQIDGEGESLKDKLILEKDLGLTLESPAKAAIILNAQKRIKHWFGTQGFPFAETAAPEVIVDHAKQSVSITYNVHSGARIRFGLIHIEGLHTVKESFLRQKILWREGNDFNRNFLAETKKNLYASGLFATVDVKEGTQLDEKGRLPVYIIVKERKHRTLKLGLSYSTDESLGGKINREHRNVLGSGENLNLSGFVSDIAYSTEGVFQRSEFLRSDQALILNLRIAEDHPDAFTSRNLIGLAKIERSFFRGMRWGAGVGFKMSKVDQLNKKEHFNLLSLPFNFDWDNSNDLLDPACGGRLNIQATPYYDTYASDLCFAKLYAHYSRYRQILSRPSCILAVSGSLGAMDGAGSDAIPADIRFYTGGGGSIRGYSFQSVGPLQNDIPIGGRSLIGLCSELRSKVTDAFGLVLFVDGGNVFEAALPDFEKSFRWGAGIGFRYFTIIGPLRFDVAFPLNRRKEMDDVFQIYVSLGQAF